MFLGVLRKPVLETNALPKALQSYVSVQLHLQSPSVSRWLMRMIKIMNPAREILAEHKQVQVFTASVFKKKEE